MKFISAALVIAASGTLALGCSFGAAGDGPKSCSSDSECAACEDCENTDLCKCKNNKCRKRFQDCKTSKSNWGCAADKQCDATASEDWGSCKSSTRDHPFPNDSLYVGHAMYTEDFANYAGTPRVGLTIPVTLEAAIEAGWVQDENIVGAYNHQDSPLVCVNFGACGGYSDILTKLSIVGPKSPFLENRHINVEESPVEGVDASALGMLTVSYCDYETTPSTFSVSTEDETGVKQVAMTVAKAEEDGYVAGGCTGSMGGYHYYDGSLETAEDWNKYETPFGGIYDHYTGLHTMILVFGSTLQTFGPKYPDNPLTYLQTFHPNYGEIFDNHGLVMDAQTSCSFNYCGNPQCTENVSNIKAVDVGVGISSAHVMFYDPSDVDQWAKCQIAVPETCVDEGDNAYLNCPCEVGATCCTVRGPFPGFVL